MFASFDPLVLSSIMMLQIANRYLKISVTTAQEKLITHPVAQLLMYFCIIYFTTRNIANTVVIVFISYIFVHILFNENHKNNILSKSWLYNEKIIDEDAYKSSKDTYKKNMLAYHS